MNHQKQSFFSFKEAKEFVHSFKLKSVKKWKAYCEERAFKNARKYARALKLKN